MSSQQSPPQHTGTPANRNPSNASTASRSISPHKRARSPDFPREPPKAPRAFLSHQNGPTAGAANNAYGARAPPGPRGRSPPPLGPRSRAAGGPLSAGSGISPVSDNYNGFRERPPPPRDFDDGYRRQPRLREVPPPPGPLERRQSMGGPMSATYPRRTSPPRRSRSPPERRAWNERMDRYPRDDFREGREEYFRPNRDERHYPRDAHAREGPRERDYSYSSSYRPEPRGEGHPREREFFHRPSVSSQGLPIVSPVDDPNKLAREQREREAAEYKKRRTAGARPSDGSERKRSAHTRSPSPSNQHQVTHSPPHTVSSRYTSNPSPSTSSPPPLSDRNNSDKNIPESSAQSSTPVAQTPHTAHPTPNYQRNIPRPTTSVPILSAPAPPSVPSFRDIPLGPRALSNTSLRTIPTGPRIPPTGPKGDKERKDGDKDDGVSIKEEHDKDRMDIKGPIDEPSPVEEGEVLNSGDERSVIEDQRDVDMEDVSASSRREDLAVPIKSEKTAEPVDMLAEPVEPKKFIAKEEPVKELLLKEPTETKAVPLDKRPSLSSETFRRDQASQSVSPTTRNIPLPSPSTESAKSSTIPTQPANFVPTSPSFTSQSLPPSVPTGPRAQFNSPSSRGGYHYGRRGGGMTPGFGRGMPQNVYSSKREEDERRQGLWNSERGGSVPTGPGRPGFVPSGPGGHYNRPGQPYTSPKLTNAELKSGRPPSSESGQPGDKGNAPEDVKRALSQEPIPARPRERRPSLDVEMQDVSQPPAATEPIVKQESPVDTKPSAQFNTEPHEDEDDQLTSSDVTKRIETIDNKIESLEKRLRELAALKQAKAAELVQLDQQDAERAAMAGSEQAAKVEVKTDGEDEVMSDSAVKQDSLSPTLAAEFAAQSMEDRTALAGPSDSSPEPEQPKTPKTALDVRPSIKDDDDVKMTDLNTQPVQSKEKRDTSSLPYFCAGPQKEPIEYAFWTTNISQHSQVEDAMLKHLMERKQMVDKKASKLRQEYHSGLPAWKQDCEKLDNEEKKKKKLDTEPAVTIPAEVIPVPATLEVSGTASLGRRSGRGVSSDFVSSEYELERILKLSEKEEADKAEAEAKEKYDDSREAIVPPMILDPEEKTRLMYLDTNYIILDKSVVKSIFKFSKPADNWNDEEQKLFKERFAQFPKQWGKIANGIEGRDYKACILHYYQTKQASPYKDLVRPTKTTRSRRNNRGRGVALTAGRTTRARASALDELARGQRNTPLDEEDVDTEDVPATGRPRRAAAPIFGETADNDGSTPVQSGKGRGAGKPSIIVEDASTPTPAEKTTGKRQRGPKADKEKKEKTASRGRTPNSALPMVEKAEKAGKGNKIETIATPKELSVVGALANLSTGATVTMTPGPTPPRGFVQEVIQPMPLLKQEPGTRMEEDTRMQQPFAAQPFVDSPGRVNLPTQGSPQGDMVQSRPIAPARRPGAPSGRGRKPQHVDEDGVVIAPVTSSYWSVPETQDFPRLLASFGTNFEAIAEHLGTKTTTMVRNNYQRGLESGKDYQAIAEDANRKIAAGEPVPQPPPPINPTSKRRYDSAGAQANRNTVPIPIQPVDLGAEIMDQGMRKQPPPMQAQGQNIFAPNRMVAVGPEARVPAQVPVQSKPGPKVGTFNGKDRPSARSTASPYVPTSNSHIQEFRTVIPPRGPIESPRAPSEPSGKSPAQAIQIVDGDEAQFDARGSSQSMRDAEMVLRKQKEQFARQQEQAASSKITQQQQQQQQAQQQQLPPQQASRQPPPVAQPMHHTQHGTQIMLQDTPPPSRYADPRPLEHYRPTPTHIENLVKSEPREKRLSGEKLIPTSALVQQAVPIPHKYADERRPRTPPSIRHRSPPLPTQPPRTISDPVAKKPVHTNPYPEHSPPRMPLQATQAQPPPQSHMIQAQQPPQVAHRMHESSSRTPPIGGAPPSITSHSPYPPTQPQAAAPVNPPAPVQAPAPAPAPPRAAGFSINSLLNDSEPSEPRPTPRPAANDGWFSNSSSTSSPYPLREPPAAQRPPAEPVSLYSPRVTPAVAHTYGRHSPAPSEQLYHSQRVQPPAPLSQQPPPSGPFYQKSSYGPPAVAQTRTPPPRSTSHPNYPPQQPPAPPQHTQQSGIPPVHSYEHHQPRDPRETRDPYAQFATRPNQYSPQPYQNPYQPPAGPTPGIVERIYPDKQHSQHIQTQQPGGYPPPPPPQYHRPGEPHHRQAEPQLPASGYSYDYRGPRQMDSHERGR